MKQIVSLCLYLLMGIVTLKAQTGAGLIGGRMSHIPLSSCVYEVRFEGYYSCSSAIIPNSISVQAHNGCTGSAQVVTLNKVSEDDVTPYCGTTICSNPVGAVPGMKKVLYTANYNICNSGCSTAWFSYGTCCRDASIINLDSPSTQNQYYQTDTVSTVSSPILPDYQYLNNGVVYLCAGQSMNVSLATVYDSTYYTLGACLSAPSTAIPYTIGYSSSSPLGSAWTVSLNSTSGYLSFTANSGSSPSGLFMLGVNMQVYKNGIFKGTVHQEIPVMVGNCNTIAYNTYHPDFTMTYNNSTNSVDCNYVGPISNPTLIKWNNGAGFGPTYSIPANSGSGFYGVSLVTGDSLCNDSMYRKLYVTSNSSSSLNVTVTPTPISTGTYTFNATISGGTPPYSYAWSVPGLPAITTNPATFNFNAPGTYNVCLIVTDAMGATITNCTAVTVMCPANSIISNPSGSNILAGNSVFFTLNNSMSSSSSYQWNFGANANPSTVSGFTMGVSTTFNTSGTYNVSVNVQDSLSSLVCTYSLPVTVNPNGPNCTANFTYSGNTYNLPANLQFTNLSPSGLVYNWDFGDGTVSTQQNPAHTYSQQGIYTACLTTQLAGTTCTDTMCQSIGINIGTDANGYIYADSTVADTFEVYLIQQTAGVLTALDSQIVWGNPAYYSFQNLNPNDSLYTKAAMVVGSPNYANYLPTYHVDALLWANATALNFMTMPPLPPSYDINMNAGINPGGPGFVGGLISQGANKTGSTGLANVNVLLLTTNYEPVAYAVTDNNGAYSINNLAYGTYLVYPDMLNKLTIPLTITISANASSLTNQNMIVQHDSIYADMTSGIVMPSTFKALNIYPNPTSQRLNIEMTTDKATNVEITLLDVTGKKVFDATTTIFDTSRYQIDMTTFTSGMYYLRLGSKENGYVLEKIIKQ